jgi:hypothetical protein
MSMHEHETLASLEFAAPAASDPRTWSYAVGEGFKFPDRFVQKCRELAQLRQEAAQTQAKLTHVVRNLISIADNCHDALAAVATADAVETASLASVQRSLVSLLEYLGVVSVELLGKTYDTVAHEGRQIDDPFEVIEAKQPGSARTLPVLDVVRPLWIQVEGDRIRIVRPGKVCC